MFAVQYADKSKLKGRMPSKYIVQYLEIDNASQAPEGWSVVQNRQQLDALVLASRGLARAWRPVGSKQTHPRTGIWRRIKKAYLA